MKKKSTQSRGGVKGGFPLAGSRGGAPCRVWGNAPTVARQNYSKGTAHKGAGSEASLPVTLRVLRRAPNLLFLLLAHCRAKWARPSCWSFRHSCSFPKAGDFASAEATKGHENRRMSAVALWKPSGCTLPCFLIFIGRLYSYSSTLFSLTFISTQGDNHHVRIYRRSRVRKNDQFLSP